MNLKKQLISYEKNENKSEKLIVNNISISGIPVTNN
jgi:hypothetical protein